MQSVAVVAPFLIHTLQARSGHSYYGLALESRTALVSSHVQHHDTAQKQ